MLAATAGAVTWASTLGAGIQPESPASVAVRPYFFALSVADLDVSGAWYERVFGFTTSQQMALPDRGIRVRILTGTGAALELVEDANSRSVTDLDPSMAPRARLRGVFKMGFEVDDLERAMTQLEALGVPRRGRIITERDGSLRSAQVEDPDGNIVQLFEILSGA